MSAWFSGDAIPITCLVLGTLWMAAPSLAASPEETAEEATVGLREKVRRLVDHLDAPSFAQREQATEELVQLDDAARPFLESILKDNAAKLSLEQRERIELILKRGPSPLLESRSGLEPADLAVLRELQSGPVEQRHSYEAMSRLSRLIREPQTRDEALALIVRALLAQVLANEKQQDGPMRSFPTPPAFREILDHKNAGPHTRRAMAEWVRKCYIPMLQRADGRSRSSDVSTADDTALRILLADGLPLETFERFLEAACAIAPSRSGGPWDEPHGTLGIRSIVGFGYSRHTTSGHLARLLQALMRQTDTTQRYGYGPFGPVEPLQLIMASPKLTERQARAAATWLVRRPKGSPAYPGAIDVSMRWLTSRTIWTAADSKGFPGPGPRDTGWVALERWQDWLAANRDKPLLARPAGPPYRYICVDMAIPDPDHPSIEIEIDAEILPGVGYYLGRPNGLDNAQWVRMEENPGYEQIARAGWRASADLKHLHVLTLDRSRAGGGSELCRLGQVFTRDHARYAQGGDRIQHAAFQLLVDPARKETVPTAEQIRDAAWWGRRAVDAFAATYRQLDSSKTGNVDGEWQSGLASLAPALCRTRHIEKAVRGLLNDPEPRIATRAALQLAQWKVSMKDDEERLVRLLESDDPTITTCAAEALSRIGRPEGVHWLIGRLKKEGLDSPALTALERHRSVGGFTPEQRAKLAGRLIMAILPEAEDELHPAVCEWLIVQRWCGYDFGYHVGGDAEENTNALARYHEWARSPQPPAEAPESRDPGAGRSRTRAR
jgi:hypothetical protein